MTIFEKIRKEYLGRGIVTVAGLLIICLTLVISIFLIKQGTASFTDFGHSVKEFLFSSEWDPLDTPGESGGKIGAAIYIVGSLSTCGLALLFATPLALGAAIFMAEILPGAGIRFFRPAVELFVGIPSIVYGWIGLTVLVPFIREVFNAPMGGYSVLAAGIVLAVMIFPTITTVATDAILSVPDSYKMASYGVGASRWQTIRNVIVPAASPGILSGVILGLARAFGEALAVAMVIGKTRAFPDSILHPTNNLTAAIAADMGNSSNNGEYAMALYSMALLLFIISMVCILIIHLISWRSRREKK